MVFHKILVEEVICLILMQKTYILGAWLTNPYIAFAAGAFVEIAAYFVVHLVLDRWGRKLPYCSFVLLFAIVAFLVVPIQTFMVKNSRGMELFPKKNEN